VGLEDIFSMDETVGVEGPAGAVFFFDTRLWHGTGANVTSNQKRPIIITVFNRFWARAIDNMTLSVSDDVMNAASNKLKTMFGMRITTSRGTVEGQTIGHEGTLIDRHFTRIGKLEPSRSLED
jgi:ectoine hydroxylase-related dioxygenase (phytanoyl-CoA dioxygenase family)